MKLHLGCGRKKLPDYVNIDLSNSDLDMDIRQLPHGSDSIDEILSVHVFEHFYLHEAGNVMAEWFRVLKPGGRLILELPCYDKVIEHIKLGHADNLTRWAMYGEPRTHLDGEPALHKWIWYMDELAQLMFHTGFQKVTNEPVQYHRPDRDMRLVGIK